MPVDLPPSPPALIREFQQRAQPPIPQVDLVVEVLAELPVREKITDVTRLLGARHRANRSRRHLPTIVELITLVERNPARPPGRMWDSITELTIGYDAATKEVIVEYCLDNCEVEPNTGAVHPQRRMASYRAPEQQVVKRLNKKLGSLQKYTERPTARQ